MRSERGQRLGPKRESSRSRVYSISHGTYRKVSDSPRSSPRALLPVGRTSKYRVYNASRHSLPDHEACICNAWPSSVYTVSGGHRAWYQLKARKTQCMHGSSASYRSRSTALCSHSLRLNVTEAYTSITNQGVIQDLYAISIMFYDGLVHPKISIEDSEVLTPRSFVTVSDLRHLRTSKPLAKATMCMHNNSRGGR